MSVESSDDNEVKRMAADISNSMYLFLFVDKGINRKVRISEVKFQPLLI